MKHRLFIVLVASLLGCVNITAIADPNNWIIDDGVMELTPEYTIQHIQGKAYSDVYAAFTFIPQKKLVQLRASDAITVNDHTLQGTADAQGYYYKARIPVTEGTFTVTLTRAPGQTMTHSFELPILRIRELPNAYRPYEMLRVPVQYVAPPQYVKDGYDLSIYGQLLRFDLVSTTRKKDNRYQFDRLPDIQDGAIVFKHITERAPQPGVYPAAIYRQQRIVLSEMSDASRTGWATLTNTQPFTIVVK
jgi:hypothetical protein